MRTFVRLLSPIVFTFAFPLAAYAQATLAGTVTDTSGAILPGVTVEVTSPALTEKVRTVVTDGSGQYRVVSLPPGSYSLTFTLPGFTALKLDGIQLAGTQTASTDVQLRVGSVEETVTVTGESPIVDVQSARRQQVIDGDVLNAIPTNRSYNSVLQLVPGVEQGNGQVQLRPGLAMFSAHGGSAEDGRLTVDGIDVGSSRGGAGVSSYVADMQNISEVAFSISGNLGEAQTGGPQMTIVPRSGSNTLGGSFSASGLTEAMQGDNFDEELTRILTAPAKVLKLWDYQASLGGPVVRDRLWYFFNWREVGGADAVPGMFANRNAGDPTKWHYDPDLSRQARNDSVQNVYALRLTAQLTARNKVSVFWDEQPQCGGSGWNTEEGCFENDEGWMQGGSQVNGFFGAGPNAPETGDYIDRFQRVQQAKWTSPATSRLLLEAGFGHYLSQWGYAERPGNPTASLVRVQEQQPITLPNGGTMASGLKYRSSNWPWGKNSNATWNAATSYVTGAHNMKFGYQAGYLRSYGNPFNVITNVHRLSYRFSNGVPNQLTMQAGPWDQKARTLYHALYAQEQWTRNRLTLQGAIRYDRAWSSFPEQQIGPDRWVPDPIVIPAADGVRGFNDITLRMGVAYDVFGDGRTAVKVNLGKYMHPASVENRYSGTNPSNRISTITSRSWTDADADYQADCNLMNPASQDLRASGGDFCGPWLDQNFLNTRPATSYDPAILSGWGVRPSDKQFGVAVQQAVLARVSVEAGYHRRSWSNFNDVTDNVLVSASDFDSFSVTAPLDPRLPGGGGNVVAGLFNVSEAKFGISENVVRASDAFGTHKRYWDGVDVSVQARLANGLRLQGGTSTGRTVDDDCEIRAAMPELGPTNPYCRTVERLATQWKGLGSYVVPTIDVQVSGTFSSRPGGDLSANVIFPSAAVIPTLGRRLSGGAANVTINVLEPNTLFGDRVNQVDLRIGKIVRVGRTRTNVAVDLVNALNSNAILSYNNTFNATWPTPTTVLTARLFRLSAQLDF